MSHVKDFEEDMVYLFQFARSPQVGAQLNLDTPEAAANTSAPKSSIRRFEITVKAPTRPFSWLKAATTGYRLLHI